MIHIGEKEYFTVNFYLERSGSMTPYDAPHGDGSFKAAIVQLLNNLPGNNDDNRIYVVNSSVNKYPQGFSKFISDPNIFESTKGLGDPSYTDFSKIFTDLLKFKKRPSFFYQENNIFLFYHGERNKQRHSADLHFGANVGIIRLGYFHI